MGFVALRCLFIRMAFFAHDETPYAAFFGSDTASKPHDEQFIAHLDWLPRLQAPSSSTLQARAKTDILSRDQRRRSNPQEVPHLRAHLWISTSTSHNARLVVLVKDSLELLG